MGSSRCPAACWATAWADAASSRSWCWAGRLLIGAVALAAVLPRQTFLPFAFLLVLRFSFGMFQAGGFPTLGRVVADWMPITERGIAQGSIWMFSRWGGALIPFLLAWLFRVWGSWPIPFLLIAGLGLFWCAAFWPWFRDRPDQMPQVNRREREIIEAGRAEISASPIGCRGRNARLDERLVAVPDVRLHRILRQLFHDDVAPLPDQAAAPFRRRNRLAFGAAASRRVDRLHPGRHRV